MKIVHPDKWLPCDGISLEEAADTAVRCSDRHVLVVAGPGAGKTELLAQKAAFLFQTNVLLTFCCFWYKMHILSKRVISMGHTIFHCFVVPKQLHDRHKEFNDRQWSESSRCGCKIKAFANL